VDNQLIQSPIGRQKLLMIATALLIATALATTIIYWHQNSDPYNPYTQEVLSLEGDTINGHDIFQINCSGCHVSQITGSVGPNLQNIAKRKSQIEIIKQVVSGRTPPMPKFQPSPQEMADLLDYLEQLN
jgi:mono/diheme cytochrome c family protein